MSELFECSTDNIGLHLKNIFEKCKFEIIDINGISREITKHNKLFDYIDTQDYLKERVRDYADYEYKKDKDHFELRYVKLTKQYTIC